jgi:dephospho-CoA kinase
LAAVVQRFGRSVLGVDGSLDRVALGALVFRDADARRALESIVHPIVQRETEAWFTSLPSTTPFAVAEIPLLYEIARERDFDAVVVAACDLATQLARLRARGMGEEDAARRIAAQLPLADKVRRADYVICTDGTMDNTAEGAAAVCAALGQRWGAAQDATSAPHADA